MSNLVETLMFPLRKQYTGNFDKNENRDNATGASEIYMKQSNDTLSLLDDELRALIERGFDNTIQIQVFDHEDVVIGDTRSCEMIIQGPDSKIITITPYTVVIGFDMVPSQHNNNDITYQALFNKKLTNRLLRLKDFLDEQRVAQLEANKNQFYPQELLDFYPEIGDALQVSQAEKNDFYNNGTAIMKTMRFLGDPDVLVNPIGMPLVARLMNQGSQNGINESFQMVDYRMWHVSNNVTNGAPDIESTGYIVAPGTVATHSRLDPDCIAERGVEGWKKWSVTRNVPIVNMDMGLYYQADCSNEQALQEQGTEGLTRTYRESFEWSADIFDITVYNSDPANRFNPIQKFEVSQL